MSVALPYLVALSGIQGTLWNLGADSPKEHKIGRVLKAIFLLCEALSDIFGTFFFFEALSGIWCQFQVFGAPNSKSIVSFDILPENFRPYLFK